VTYATILDAGTMITKAGIFLFNFPTNHPEDQEIKIVKLSLIYTNTYIPSLSTGIKKFFPT